MSDLIRRQDAIDELAGEWYNCDEDYRTAVSVIKGLPSADRPKGDLISRQAVLDEIDDVSDVCEEICQIEWCAELRTRVIALPSEDRPPKVVAQVTFDEEKLREIVKGAVERLKEEYEITDRPTGKWIVKHGSHGYIRTSWYACDQCGGAGDISDKFCKHCGTKMGVKC